MADTTAGRLLEKKGEGGYMVIMQTGDAAARRSVIEGEGLAKVIFSHETEESVCVQYHPKGIRGQFSRCVCVCVLGGLSPLDKRVFVSLSAGHCVTRRETMSRLPEQPLAGRAYSPRQNRPRS